MDHSEAPGALANSSSDTFSLLSSYLAAQDLGRLWICGNNDLQHCLKRDPLEVNLVVEPGTPFPLLLTEFANTRVLRARYAPQQTSMFVQGTIRGRIPLNLLPSSIQEMEFDFPGDYLSFVRFASEGSNTDVELLDLKNLLPNLLKLQFKGDANVERFNLVRGSSDLRDDFTLAFTERYPLIRDQESLSTTPSCVDALNVRLPELSSKTKITPPSQLSSLQILDSMIPNIESFPNGIEKLSVDQASDDVQKKLFSEPLPSTIRSLSVPYTSSSLWDCIPAGITDLSLFERSEDTEIEFKHLQRLSELRSLSIAPVRPVSLDEVLPHLPPSVTCFEVHQAEFPLSCLAKLPPHLTTLKVDNNDEANDADAALVRKTALPTSLKTLEWNVLNYSVSLENPLPCLTSLTAETLPSGTSTLDLPSLKILRLQTWEGGVEVLKEGKFELEELSISKSISLESLTQLDLAWPSLASLKVLTLYSRPSKEEKAPEGRCWPANLRQSSLAFLNLAINFQDGKTRIPAQFLNEVPTTLKGLAAKPMVALEVKDLANLPPRLVNLSLIGMKSIMLSDVGLYKVLPKTLQHIEVSGYDIEEEKEAAFEHFYWLFKWESDYRKKCDWFKPHPAAPKASGSIHL